MSFETKCIHAHQEPEPPNYPITYPIYQTSNFFLPKFEKAVEILSKGAKFDHDKTGLYIYSRGTNPTLRAFELLVADLENAEDGVAFASGMAAITAALIAFLESGDIVYYSDVIYGGTNHLLKTLSRKFKIKAYSLDMSNPENLESAIKKFGRPKIVYIETPGNPTLKIVPMKEIAEIAHQYDAIVIADNTLATPYFQNPINYGVDIVVHSATKYLAGHSDVLGGVVVGSFEHMEKVRKILFYMGAVLDPFAAWLIIRGIKTLHVRMPRHEENAMRIAEWLETLGFKVNYPGLKSFEYHELAKKQMRGFSGILSFDVGDMTKALKVVNSVKIIKRAVSFGGVESLIEHPATSSHYGVPEDELKRAGVTPGLIRISVGIEKIDDLINDLEQALKSAELI